MAFNVNKYEKQTSTTRLKDSIKRHGQGSRPKLKLVTNGLEVQNKNKHSSPDKIRRLHMLARV